MTYKITPEIKVALERIMQKIDCPKDYICYRDDFKQLCKVEVASAKGDRFLCVDAAPCKLSIQGMYCNCPVRKYIALKIEKLA